MSRKQKQIDLANQVHDRIASQPNIETYGSTLWSNVNSILSSVTYREYVPQMYGATDMRLTAFCLEVAQWICSFIKDRDAHSVPVKLVDMTGKMLAFPMTIASLTNNETGKTWGQVLVKPSGSLIIELTGLKNAHYEINVQDFIKVVQLIESETTRITPTLAPDQPSAERGGSDTQHGC